jgi:hypothetical protein
VSGTAANRLDYVHHCLQLNPATQAREILLRRSQALGLTLPDEPLGVDAARGRQDLRTRLQGQLDAIRQVFWTQPVAVLQQDLNRLDVADFPELLSSVNRLRYLSDLRDQVVYLTGCPNINANLLNTLKRVFMLPPQEAGRLKNQYLAALPSNPALPQIQAMVQMMAQQVPQLYQVEQVWFDQMLELQPGQMPHANLNHPLGGSVDTVLPGFAFAGTLVFILLAAVIRALSLATR